MRIATTCLVLFGLCLAVPMADATAQKAFDAEAMKERGFKPLFDGTSLDAWKIPEGDGGHWQVLDGVIDYDAQSEAKGDKNLWTKDEFGDFRLHVEWRLKDAPGLYNMPTILPDGSYKTDADGKVITVPTPNADSGILLRSMNQINIWCWPIGSGELWSVRTNQDLAPELRAAAVPKMKADNPVGEWNRFLVTLKGNVVTVLLNGKKVIDQAEIPGIPERGPIGLQHHGGINPQTGQHGGASSLIQFRNVWVKELD